jgi:hypothetical protein
MTGGWLIGEKHSNVRSYGFVAGTSLLTALTSGAANTKGSYVALTTATVGDASSIIVHSRSVTTSDNSSLDIAVGGSGSEKIIVPDFIVDSPTIGILAKEFPVAIPAGTRISARMQSLSATDTSTAAVTLLNNAGTGDSGTSVDTLGFASATTVGTTIDAGGTANTKGTYVQIISSTVSDYSAFCFHFDVLGRGSQSGSASFLVDIAIGGSGSEVIIVPDYPQFITTSTSLLSSFSPWFKIAIKAGTRIAVRSQCSVITTPNRTWGCVIYGLRGS